MIYGDIWWIYPASLPFHPSPWTSASMSDQPQPHILKLTCRRHAPCSGMWISQFLPHLKAPVQSRAGGFFFFCWVGLPEWLGTPTLWHSLLPAKCLIADSFTTLHENPWVPGRTQTAGPFCSSSKKNQALWRNLAPMGGRAFLENLAFEFSFLKGSFLTYSNFNSVSTALGRLCSMK